MMIWRLYPISIFMGLVLATVVQLALMIVGMLVLAVAGVDTLSGPLPNLFAQPDLRAVLLASSFLGVVFAGYTAARFAPGEELVNACATGVIVLVLGLSSFRSPPMNLAPTWFELVAVGPAPLLAAAGGLLFRRRALAA